MTRASDQIDAAENLVNEVQQRTGGVASKKQLMNVRRSNAAAQRVTIAIVAMISVIALIACGFLAVKIAQLESANTLREASVRVLEQANVDRQSIGLPPIPIPTTNDNESLSSASAEVDLRALSDAAAAVVLREIKNDPTFRGMNGPPGAPCDPNTNPLCVGPKGEDSVVPGPSGPPPTCEDEPGESCVGEEGDPGRSVSNAAPIRMEDGTCVFRTTYSDGTNSDSPPIDPISCPL